MQSCTFLRRAEPVMRANSGPLAAAEKHAYDMTRNGVVDFADAVVAEKRTIGAPGAERSGKTQRREGRRPTVYDCSIVFGFAVGQLAYGCAVLVRSASPHRPPIPSVRPAAR